MTNERPQTGEQQRWYARVNRHGQSVVFESGRERGDGDSEGSDGEVCRTSFVADADRIVALHNASLAPAAQDGGEWVKHYYRNNTTPVLAVNGETYALPEWIIDHIIAARARPTESDYNALEEQRDNSRAAMNAADNDLTKAEAEVEALKQQIAGLEEVLERTKSVLEVAESLIPHRVLRLRDMIDEIDSLTQPASEEGA